MLRRVVPALAWVFLASVALPIALASVLGWRTVARERALIEEEAAREDLRVERDRARLLEEAVAGIVRERLETLAALSDPEAFRSIADRDPWIDQAFVWKSEGSREYPPPPASEPARSEADSLDAVAGEPAFDRARELEISGDPASALPFYASLALDETGLAAAPASFRAGVCRTKLGEVRQAEIDFSRAARLAEHPYLRLAALLEELRAHLASRPEGDEGARLALELFREAAWSSGPRAGASAALYFRGEAQRILDEWLAAGGMGEFEDDWIAARLRLAAEERVARTLETAGSRISAMAASGAESSILATSSGALLAFGPPDAAGRIVGFEVSAAERARLEQRYAAPTAFSDPAAREREVWRRVPGDLAILGIALGLALSGVAFLARAARRERRASAARSAWVRRVSHELATPLTIVRGLAETLHLGRVRDPEKVSRYLETIVREGEALSRLLDGVLDQARSEAPVPREAPADLDLAQLARETASSIGVWAEAAGFTVQVRTSGDPATVRGERDALSLALSNLLANAVKYSGASREVEIEVSRENGSVAVRVLDRGPGVDPAEALRIFEPFVRGSAATAGIRGSGLGLALVREVATRHGGAVRAEPREGGGSVFTLVLPNPGGGP